MINKVGSTDRSILFCVCEWHVCVCYVYVKVRVPVLTYGS